MIGAKKHPIKLASADADSRLVYSPHIYGPSVYDQEYFKVPEFPNNLPEVWENQFGFLIPELKKGVIVGEWGGSCLGKDLIVQEQLGQWLQQNCMANNIWWSLNPGSEDTGKYRAPNRNMGHRNSSCRCCSCGVYSFSILHIPELR